MLGLKPLTAAYRAVAQRPRGSTSCCRWPEWQRKDARTWQGAVEVTVLSVSLPSQSVSSVVTVWMADVVCKDQSSTWVNDSRLQAQYTNVEQLNSKLALAIKSRRERGSEMTISQLFRIAESVGEKISVRSTKVRQHPLNTQPLHPHTFIFLLTPPPFASFVVRRRYANFCQLLTKLRISTERRSPSPVERELLCRLQRSNGW
jgi:hypothetical protein